MCYLRGRGRFLVSADLKLSLKAILWFQKTCIVAIWTTFMVFFNLFWSLKDKFTVKCGLHDCSSRLVIQKRSQLVGWSVFISAPLIKERQMWLGTDMRVTKWRPNDIFGWINSWTALPYFFPPSRVGLRPRLPLSVPGLSLETLCKVLNVCL